MNIDELRTQVSSACQAMKAWFDLDPMLEELGDDHPFCKLGNALLAARDALKDPVSVAAEGQFPRLLFQEAPGLTASQARAVAQIRGIGVGPAVRGAAPLTAESHGSTELTQEEIAALGPGNIASLGGDLRGVDTAWLESSTTTEGIVAEGMPEAAPAWVTLENASRKQLLQGARPEPDRLQLEEALAAL